MLRDSARRDELTRGNLDPTSCGNVPQLAKVILSITSLIGLTAVNAATAATTMPTAFETFPPSKTVQDLTRQASPLFCAPSAPLMSDSPSIQATMIAHVHSGNISNMPARNMRQGRCSRVQTNSVLRLAQIPVLPMPLSEHRTPLVADKGQEEFGKGVWTLALMVGVCVRMYLNSETYGQEIRGVPIKVEDMTTSIGNITGMVRERMDLSEADEWVQQDESEP